MPFISLAPKPNAPLYYELIAAPSSAPSSVPLVVFINGLGLPCASWKPALSLLQASPTSPPASFLLYDRYGQSRGQTLSRDPLDSLPSAEPGYGHTVADAAADLHTLLESVAPAHLHNLVLVAASIGPHIARLYAAAHPAAVAGLLLLDANIGNREVVEMWPDPRAEGFDPAAVVADDCTI